MSDSQEDADRRVGMNLRHLREEANVTQVELARAMTALGWQWHQSTVARVEAGQQPVRFAEAEAVVQILDGTLERLTREVGPEAEELRRVVRHSVFLRRSFGETTLAIRRHLHLLDVAGMVLTDARAQFQGSSYQRVLDACSELEADIRSCSPETAVQEAAKPREALRETDHEEG